MTRSATIARNSAYLYLRMLVVLATSLYTVRVVLRALGVDDFGIYGVAGGMVAVFAFLNNTMSTAAQRFLGIDIGRDDDVALGKTFNATLVAHGAIALGLVLLGETLGLWLLNHALDIPPHRLQAANAVLHLSIAATVALVMRTPFNALIIARQRMWFFSATSVLEAALKLAIAFLITRTGFDRLVFYAVLVCTVSWLMLVCYVVFCRIKFAESRLALHRDRSIYKALVAFISWSFIGSLANVFRTQGVNTLLNVYFGPALNAAHGVMTQAQSAATQFTGSFQMALSPQIYQSYAQDSHRRMHALLFTGAKLNFILLAVLVAPAIYGLDYLLAFWLGSPPSKSSLFVKWMLLGLLVETVSQPLVTAAAATGKIRDYQLLVGGSILLNLPLSWLAFALWNNPAVFLYVSFGIQFLTFALRVWFLRKMIGLDAGAFLRSVAFPLLLVSAIGGVLVFIVGCWPGPPHDFPTLLFGSALLACLILVASILFGLGSEERSFFFELLRKRLKKAKPCVTSCQ